MKDLVRKQKQQVSHNVSISKINPYSEPLLWIQLLGGALIPIESLIILIIQAGVRSSSLPGLERLLLWGIGVLGPAIIFWYLPLNCWSLLILQIPIKSRSLQQKAISLIPRPLWLKLFQTSVAIPLLLLIEQVNQIGSEIIMPSLLQGSSRILRVCVTIILLISMTFHWQQFIQAIWLMITGSKHNYNNDSSKNKWTEENILFNTLNLGLPLLVSKPLNIFIPKDKVS